METQQAIRNIGLGESVQIRGRSGFFFRGKIVEVQKQSFGPPMLVVEISETVGPGGRSFPFPPARIELPANSSELV